MTLLNALEELKAKGITKLSGFYTTSDINAIIENAQGNHENAVKYAAKGIETWQYSLDHEDDSFMVETADGHFIIVTHYGFDMPTYSTYDTEKEMYTAFDEWRIAQQAAEIADEKVKEDNSIPREAWVLVATEELRKAYKAVDKDFNRKYGTN